MKDRDNTEYLRRALSILSAFDDQIAKIEDLEEFQAVIIEAFFALRLKGK